MFPVDYLKTIRKRIDMDNRPSILLVDDNRDVLQSLDMVLELNGYRVETARDGISALEMCAAKRYDAVLMDISMPRLTGTEAFRRLKATQPDTRVILMSAYMNDQESAELTAEGLFRALGKPMKISELLDVLQEATTHPRIIIVDDDPSIGGTLVRILRMKGYNCYSAESGREAIRLVVTRKNDIEIALVDLKMPDMDGFATLSRLKQIKPELDVVLMTAYRDEMMERISVAAREHQAGCLFKPIDPERVIEIAGRTRVKIAL
jgi:CheY-like chemotaxis protein